MCVIIPKRMKEGLSRIADVMRTSESSVVRYAVCKFIDRWHSAHNTDRREADAV